MIQNKKQLLLVLSVLTFLAYFFIPPALNRLVARDEGYYILAAQLVANGKLPYIDFFFPQTPLTAFVYGAWAFVFGSSWTNARLLSGILSVLLGFLLWRHLYSSMGKCLAFVGLLLYCYSSFIFSWFPIAETYALSVPLLFAAYTSASRTSSSACLSGLFFGLSIATRLFFAGLFPIFILLTGRQLGAWDFSRIRKFAIGLLLGLLPLLLLAVLDPQNVWFNIFGYHLLRSPQGFVESLPEKLHIAGVVALFFETRKFDGFEFSILCVLSALYGIVQLIGSKVPDYALAIAAGLFLLSLLPTPSYVQYFAALTPFLIVCVLSLVKVVVQEYATSTVFRMSFIVLFVTLFVFYVLPYRENYQRYTDNGKGVIGLGTSQNISSWKVRRIEETVAMINRYAKKDDVLVPLWPGYAVGVNARIEPGTENHFGRRAANELRDIALEARYRILSAKSLKEKILRRIPDYIILNLNGTTKVILKSLKAGGYQERERLEEIVLYARSKDF